MDTLNIEPIVPPALPFDLDDKIFKDCMCEDVCECPLKSYNDRIQMLKDISGVNTELMGPK